MEGTVRPGDITLDRLIAKAEGTDFAVLVAAADDVTTSRGDTTSSPRDNVILELGIFLGAIGRERTYVLTPAVGLKLPTDLSGLTRLTYHDRPDQDLAAAVNQAVRQIEDRVKELGPRPQIPIENGSNAVRVDREHVSIGPSEQPPATGQRKTSDERQLDAELEQLQHCATEQGWTMKRGAHALRLSKSSRPRQTLPIGDPVETRRELRTFVARLRADGLRVTHTLRTLPLELNPWG